MAYPTSNAYKQVIYSGEAGQSLTVKVNNSVIQNADEYIETISRTARVFPNGSTTFNINDLVSTEIEITLHDLDTSNWLNNTLEIIISTEISSNTTEDVPLGKFIIQEIKENDSSKIVLKARDNSVKLDVPYNAKPLLDANDGTATLLQILNDICTTCGITTKIQTFPHDDKLIGIYDNTINARIYINYIAGQAGAIPIIDRDGELDFTYVNNLTIHKIPLNIVEKYELGKPYKITKVVYESGIIKYESTLLPNEYTQVDYIEPTGTAYIDTGIKAKGSLKVISDIEFTTTPTGNMFLFGGRNASSNKANALLYANANQTFRNDYNNTTSNGSPSITNLLTKWHILKDKGSLTLTSSDNQTITSTIANATFTSDYNMYIFNANNGGSLTNQAKYRLYNFKLYDNDVLVRDFIPCYKNSNNEAGLYDLVSGEFFANQGSGVFTSGDITKQEIMYIDSANVYVNSQEQVDDVFDIVKDFTVDSVETGKIIGDPAIDAWDLIQVYGYYNANDEFVPDENTIVFTTFANNKFTFSGTSTSQYETIISEETRDTNVSLKSEATYKKSVKTDIDLINGTLQLINEEYLDFIKDASGSNYVEVTNMYSNGITKLQIMGTMSLIFPANDLYPSNTLYPLDSYLVVENTTTEEKKYYQLNIDYLNTGDKYIYIQEFDEESNSYIPSAKIVRSNNVEIPLEAPLFDLDGGDYKIYMQNFTGLQYQVEYVIHNELTNTLATNTQLSTAITTTRNEIDLKASQMVNKDSVIADLNVAIKDGQGTISLTGNQVVIESDNFKVTGEGKIEATSGEIGGFDLGAEQFNSTFTGLYNYNKYDLVTAQAYALGLIQSGYDLRQIYDLNNSGTIDALDVLKIQKILLGLSTNEKTTTGKIRIDSKDPKNGLYVLSNSNEPIVSLGVGGINSEMITGRNLILGNADNLSTDSAKIIASGDTGTINCVSVIQSSLEEKKKNFEKLENAINIIKDIDIYKYNMKDENDETKKHIGFVIGDNYNYSTEITSDKNNGVDLYSFVSVCCQAIKEQQQIIEDLQNEITKLKEVR